MHLKILLVAFGVGSLLACGGRHDSEVVFEIGDEGYTQEDFDRYLRESLPRDEPALRAELKSALFDEFIEERLLRRSAVDEGIEIPDAEVERELSRQSIEPTEENGARVRATIRDRLAIRRLLETRVLRQVRVDDEEIARHYEARRTFYRRSEVVEVSQVLLEEEARAAEIRSLLTREPDRFEEIARSDSVGPEASRDGQMGSFTRGQLPASFEDVVFELPAGQISEVVTTDYGFHIFKVIRKTPSRELSLEDVQDAIKVELLREKSDAAMLDFIAELRLRHPVTIHANRLNFNYVDTSLDERREGVGPDRVSTP